MSVNIFKPRPETLFISDSIFEILNDHFEEDQDYQEKPDDKAWFWYIDLANYNSAFYDHWSTKDVYELLKHPEFQFCDGSAILEDSLDYWEHQREEIPSEGSAVTAIWQGHLH